MVEGAKPLPGEIIFCPQNDRFECILTRILRFSRETKFTERAQIIKKFTVRPSGGGGGGAVAPSAPSLEYATGLGTTLCSHDLWRTIIYFTVAADWHDHDDDDE